MKYISSAKKYDIEIQQTIYYKNTCKIQKT